MSTPDPVLAAAVAAHQAGRLQEAIDGYEDVLTRRPDDTDALHFFGMLHFQLGRGIDAVRLIATAQTIHVGRTTATAYGHVHADGKLVAHGTTTCFIDRRTPATGTR